MAIFSLLKKVNRFFFGSGNSSPLQNETNYDKKQPLTTEPMITISLFSVVEMILVEGVKKEDAVKAVENLGLNLFLDGFNENSLRILSTTLSGGEIICALKKTGFFKYEYWLNDFPGAPRYIIWLFQPLIADGGEIVRYEKCLGLKTDDGKIRLFNPRGKLLAKVPIETIESQGKILPYPLPPAH